MQIVWIDHGSFAHLHAMSTFLSIAILVGAVYGCIRLLGDGWRFLKYLETKMYDKRDAILDRREARDSQTP